ncbi:spectinomycin phosphotransferase [Pedococcus dokdonensis]|uniref:Spectinomycin phosphotransferase n=1 Tax=Pedococcus dokdonensis TaxID=443156 RepID=A0A1H0TE24_9MICO|nr:aminoglycoside phosphotransferase family protein [Pedococcus dokdonensis]SDP52071.1 spectinomycin phosphotransferase [Pedococcus dokdonensis]
MELLRRVREDFGIPLIGVRPTGLGADARATLWRGETADGTGYAVKSSTAPQPGLVVADFLAACGVPGVPDPVRTTGGSLTAPLADGSVVSVVPWIDGARAIETGLDGRHWRAFGAALGAVHATAPAAPLLDGPDRPGLLALDRHDPTPEVRRAREFGSRLDAALGQSPEDRLLSELAGLWHLHGGRVLEVAALAESTALDRPAWQDVAPVICHADPHQGNLLLGSAPGDGTGTPARSGAGGESAGVWLVDWDDAVLAPREADLIFVVGGVFSFAPITATDVAAFFDGYTPASGGCRRGDLDESRLTHYRATRALTDFLDFAEEVLDRGPSEPDRAASLRIAAGAVSPDGLVTITLSEAPAEH